MSKDFHPETRLDRPRPGPPGHGSHTLRMNGNNNNKPRINKINILPKNKDSKISSGSAALHLSRHATYATAWQRQVIKNTKGQTVSDGGQEGEGHQTAFSHAPTKLLVPVHSSMMTVFRTNGHY